MAPVHAFAVRSEIGRSRATHVEAAEDYRLEIYTESYRPGHGFREQLNFAFRYQGIHLEFLARLFMLPQAKIELEQWIACEPTGSYARRACFLFEWLTSTRLEAPNVSTGNYVNALDPDSYVVGSVEKNKRWRVNDNLPGAPGFCPMIRRTNSVVGAESYDMAAKLAELETDFGIDLLMRSSVWLTVKESRASFLIEREQDKEDRIRRFAAVMESECGKHGDPFATDTLVSLQKGILGEIALRYGLRKSPVYVGHAERFQPVVDYIAPHWNDTESLLMGLSSFLARTCGISPIIRAAVASFGFVYVHPMADGNGRISRFLINDVLRRDGVVPPPIILPVSATITNSTHNRAAYDQVLERFSRPLLRKYADNYRFAESVVADDGVEYNFHFDKYQDSLPAWRYPDMTAHVAYLAGVIDATLMHEMRTEAQFLLANDNARAAIKSFLEAPDNELDVIIRSVRQSGNTISNNLRKRFPLLEEKPDLGERIIGVIVDAFSKTSTA